jgi:hypothetical protein
VSDLRITEYGTLFGLRFTVYGLGFRVVGFTVKSAGFRVCRVYGLEFRV